jgi:hypothetical protein
MSRPIYRIDETAKAVLRGLKIFGLNRSFAQIVERAGILADPDKQLQVAETLEDLDLITSVRYQLPFALHAELTRTGEALVQALNQISLSKISITDRKVGKLRWPPFAF